ncbi:tetratricopeptide repeat protein [Arhodomonas sp. AD133]|uniref:tetratricopeptide repeat protein n=1 Tax=Arhodomonas sp. AD133 TaxID=3415009 RepID=UPI003EBBBF69
MGGEVGNDAGDYERVYRLLREGAYEDAIDEIMKRSTGRVRSPYSMDLNHAWYVLGNLYYESGDYASALESFKKAYRHRPSDAEAMWAIANCYSEIGKPRWSVYYLKKAISVTGGGNELHYNLGNALFDMGDYSAAIREYKKVDSRSGVIYDMAQNNIGLARRMCHKDKKNPS